MFPKPQRIKNEAYRRYVVTKPCFGCGIEGYSQAAHPNGAGAGTKHSDLDVFPLCCSRLGLIGCHMDFDMRIGMTKEEHRELSARYVARMHAIARADGRPEFREAA